MKQLTWDELADAFDRHGGRSRPARTLPMELVADWAEARTDLFYVDDDGCFCHVAPKKES